MRDSNATKIVRLLTVKCIVALAILAALAAANFVILRLTILENARLADIVKQAENQRTFLHRSALHAEQFVFAFDKQNRSQARDHLITDASALQNLHHELMPAEPSSRRVVGEVRAVYEDSPWLLDSEMRNYLIHVRSLANAQGDEIEYSNPHFTYVRDPVTIDKIGKGLDQVVQIYERRSNDKSEQLNQLAIWSFVSTLLMLLVSGWFIFRPMALKVRSDVDALDQLNRTLEERVAERTREAEERAEHLARSESALRESQALYASLVHHMPMSLIRKDVEGRLTFANRRFCELIGRSLPDIVGRSDADLFPTELARKYRQDDQRVMETGRNFQDTEEHVTQDGERRVVEVSKVRLSDSDGRVIGTQSMFWDVTDRKLAEERAVQSERLAAIGQMVAGVAHESRNALQQIQACSQMLKWDLEGDAEKQDLINDLQLAEKRLLSLFEELRSYAAPLNLEQVPCDLRSIISKTWAELEHQRKGRDVTLSEVGAETDWVCIVDTLKVSQVFRNLFENSIAAASDPVKIQVVYQEVPDGSIEIIVSDNGPGLSPEQQKKIFDPFFTTKTQGSGLGMAIVKRIVEAHGGTISAATGTPGAIMTVRLPRGAS